MPPDAPDAEATQASPRVPPVKSLCNEMINELYEQHKFFSTLSHMRFNDHELFLIKMEIAFHWKY